MRTQMPFGAKVSRPRDQVWNAISSGNGLEFLLGTHFANLLGHPLENARPARMRLSERYRLAGGTVTKDLPDGFELEVTVFEAPHRFVIAGAFPLQDDTISVGIEVRLDGDAHDTEIEVRPWIEQPGSAWNLVTQFGATLQDLWDLQCVDNLNLRNALEDAVPATESAVIQRAAGRTRIVATIAGLVLSNIIAVALAIHSGASVHGLLLLYWAENFVLAAFTLFKIILAGRIPGAAAKLIAGALFLVVFANFWEFQADVIRQVIGLPRYHEYSRADWWGPFAALQAIASFFSLAWSGADSPGFAALAVLFAAHAFTFGFDYLARSEYRYAHLGVVLREPALWLVIVQGGVIAGALAANLFGGPMLMLWLIAAVKIALELRVRRVWYRSN
jgi:hypothetical protein